MKKRLLSVAFLMGAMAANAQVGIGVKDPNLSAELTVSAPNRGLLIPNVKLTGAKDVKTISKGNVESLLVFNTNTTDLEDKVDNLTPGYHYWHINRWARLTADQDIPRIVVNKFEEILKMDGDKVTTLIKNLIKGNETLTVLAYNPTTGTLTYTDEKKQPTTVDIKAAVKSFETVTSIATDAVAGTITFKDEAGKSTVLNLKELVEAHETVTVLTRVAPGNYIYKNEAGTNKEINVIGDITEVIKNKTDQDLYNVLKNIVKVEETLTKLIYNAPQKQLTYTDEKAVAHNIDVEKLVQDNQIISELSAGKNISVTQVQNGNKITYTLDVPTATKDVPGVVKPGSGLDIDADGNLTVNLGSALNGKDLIGNNIIVVTDGKGAVLKETKLSVNEKEIKLENLGGTLNLTQLQNGKAGDVLVVNENGEVEWSAKEAITTNKLELVGSELVSTVNGVESKQTLEDKLTTEMLQNKSVTAEKLGATPAEQGKVPVVQKDGSVVYGNVSSDNVDGKALKSANDLMTVSLEAGVVLKDVTLTVNQGNFDLAQIGGTLKLTQLEKGKDGEVLVTDKDGTVKWVKGDNQVIKEMVKANETVTTLVDNGNGTFTYHNEDDYDVDGKLIPGKDGITFNANTLKIEAADGVYTFTDGNGELAKIDTKAKASIYDNSNSGLTSNNVQDAIDELIKKVGVVANTKGSLTSTDITVGNGIDALLKDVTLAIADGAVTTDKIKDGAVTTEKIKAGKDGEVLVTVTEDGTEITKWVPKDTVVKSVETVTQLVENKNGTFTYYNESEIGKDGKPKADAKGVEIDPSLVNVEKQEDSYVFTNSKGDTIATIKFAAGDISYTNTKLGDTTTVGGAIDKLVERIEAIEAKRADLSTDGIILVNDSDKLAKSVLEAATLSIKAGGITEKELGENSVTTEKIKAGKDGEVLVTVTENGTEITKWVPKKDATSNELSSKGNTMTSTVNGVTDTAEIIEKVENTLGSDNKLVTTVNGVPGEGLDLTPAIVAGQNTTSVTNGSEKVTVVTTGVGTKDKNTEYTVDVNEAALDLGKIGGQVTEKQIKPGKDGEVLVTVTENGTEITKWVPKDATSNELKLDGNTLVSTVNGVESNVDLTDKISKEMLKEGSVTKEKINKDVAGEGLTKNENTGALDVDFDKVKEELAKGNVTSKTIVVTGGDKSTFKNVELEIKAGENAGDVLVTKVDGEGNKTTEWKTPEVVATTNELSSTENTMTSNVNGVSKSADIINSVGNTLGANNELITTVNGVAGTGVDLTPAIVAGQEKTKVAAGHAVTVSPKIEDKTTTYTVAVDEAKINAVNTELDGDVTGTAGANTISQLQGNPIDAKNPAGGNVLVFEGGKWINKTPVIDAGNVTNGKALTSGQNTISITGEGSTALLKDVQIDVANGAITSDKIKDGAVTPGKLEAGKDGEVLTTTETKDSEGKTITTVEWKKPVIEAGDVTKGGSLTSKTENLLTVENGDGTVLQDVSLTVNESAFDISNMTGNLTVNRLEAGNEGQVLETVKEGENEVVKWVDKSKPTVIKGGNSTTSNVIVTPGTNGNENEYTVDVKAAMPKVFYMPPVMFDTSKTGTGKTRNLYEEYKAMFTGDTNVNVVDTPISEQNKEAGKKYMPELVKNPGAGNSAIPVFKQDELNFFVPYYDPTVFANVSVSDKGVLTYDIIKKAKYGAFMTVVFVVK